MDSGTRQHLQAIHCVSPDEVLIAGGNSTLLRGNARTGFRRVRFPSVDVNFWSVRAFADAIYLGSGDGLYRLKGNDIDLFRPEVANLPSRFTVQSLDSRDDALWVIADRFVMRHIGTSWELFAHPDNE